MDGLIQLVADSFIRHGLESPAVGDSRFVWGRAPSPVQASPSSAVVGGQSTTGYALARTTTITPGTRNERGERASHFGSPRGDATDP
jgi:hypothetical protein